VVSIGPQILETRDEILRRRSKVDRYVTIVS
jgi:hypothetical protein